MGIAHVSATFSMPPGWSEKFRMYTLDMIFEDNDWKIAGPVKSDQKTL